MLRYRPFRNGDPQALAEIWRTQPPERGLMQPMSAGLFEHEVLAKPYFDNAGLIVAVDGDEPVGFAHAAFGPNEGETSLCTRFGVTCLVMVRANFQNRGIGGELLDRSERYLTRMGAEVLYAGGIRPLNAFYLGLYGGCELPGVLDSGPRAQRLFLSRGYKEIDRSIVLHRDLVGFRAPVDRKQLLIRRNYLVRSIPDPTPASWWEACTWGALERTRFELVPSQGGAVAAQATFWSMQPLAASWGVHAAGLLELETSESHQRQGLATFLLGEAFRRLQVEQVSLVEVQTMRHNAAALKLYEKLGFREVDQGAVYRKE